MWWKHFWIPGWLDPDKQSIAGRGPPACEWVRALPGTASGWVNIKLLASHWLENVHSGREVAPPLRCMCASTQNEHSVIGWEITGLGHTHYFIQKSYDIIKVCFLKSYCGIYTGQDNTPVNTDLQNDIRVKKHWQVGVKNVRRRKLIIAMNQSANPSIHQATFCKNSATSINPVNN